MEFSGRAVQGQQSAIAAPEWRLLGDQLGRQVEVEILTLRFVGRCHRLALILYFSCRLVVVEP